MKFERKYKNEKHLSRIEEGIRDLDYADKQLAENEMIERSIAEGDLLWEMHKADVNVVGEEWGSSARMKAMDMQNGSIKETKSKMTQNEKVHKEESDVTNRNLDCGKESDGFAAVIDSYMEGAKKDIGARIEGIDKKVSVIDHLKHTQGENEAYNRARTNLLKSKEELNNNRITITDIGKATINASTESKIAARKVEDMAREREEIEIDDR